MQVHNTFNQMLTLKQNARTCHDMPELALSNLIRIQVVANRR